MDRVGRAAATHARIGFWTLFVPRPFPGKFRSVVFDGISIVQYAFVGLRRARADGLAFL